MDMMTQSTSPTQAAPAAPAGAEPGGVREKLKQAQTLIGEALAAMGEDPAQAERMSAEDAFSGGFEQG